MTTDNPIVQRATREDCYDFIPDKLVMGKIKQHSEADYDIDLLGEESRQLLIYAAIPSCRYMNHSWTSLHRFSKLTGFKPNVQRDCEKELDKAATNACEEIENVPISGIKIISLNANVYNYCDKSYDYSGDALVYDPRGFTVQISREHLSQMIAENHGNISDYTLSEVKYVYIASSSGMTLIPYESNRCKKIIAKQNSQKDKNGKMMYVKPSQLTVGHAYATSDVFAAKYQHNFYSGTYIFAGRQDMYSISLIRTALSNHQYPDIAHFMKNNTSFYERSQPTYKNAYIFFLAAPKTKLLNNFTFAQSIVVVDSPSKLFCKEVPVDADWKWINQPDKPLNIDTIKDFMDSNPYFTKIDMQRSFNNLEYEELSINNFGRIAAELNHDNFYKDGGFDFDTTVIPYPCNYNYIGYDDFYGILSSRFSSAFRMSAENRSYGYSGFLPTCKILADESKVRNFPISNIRLQMTPISDRGRSFFTQPPADTSRNKTLGQMYDEFKPIVPKIYLENGRQLDQMFFSLICSSWIEGYEDVNHKKWSKNHADN